MASWNGRPRIVVGVDGSAAALEAVRYAAHEALSSGAHLEIAHATPGIVRVGPGATAVDGLTPAQCRAIGMRILNGARKVAREVTGDTWEISTALLDGPPAAMLVAEAAHDAQLLVLGDQRFDERFFTGSVLVRVVDTSRVPVVVVPQGWAGGPAPGMPGVVAVGVQEVSGSEHLLRRALAIAEARGVTLRVVHAWHLPKRYDDLVADRIGSPMSARAGLGIEAVVHRVRRDFPSVEVELRLVHGQPARVLREETRHADLLVLGRRALGTLESHLGATGRALLREAVCPLEVVPLASGQTVGSTHRALDPELVG